MAIYKRGKVYWYEFRFGGELYRQTASTGNAEAARQIEAAHRVRLAKGEAGIKDRPKAPTLAAYAPKFMSKIETDCADKPATVSFYREKVRRLLDNPQLAALRLNEIDEAAIDAYRQTRTRQPSRYGTPMSPASVNRELATLRRLIRIAQDQKIIERAAKVQLLRGEKGRDFVLSHKAEPGYLEACPQPLKDVALLILETGARPGEAVGLRWADVHLEPAAHAKLGYIRIRKGKSQNAKRNLSLSEKAAAMLRARRADSKSVWVFPGDTSAAAILGTSLDHQHSGLREALKLPKDFVIHSLRHTMLTRLGEAGADAFSIMKIAGHSSVTVSQRYVHPTPEGLERAFGRLQELNSAKVKELEEEAKNSALDGEGLPTKVHTAKSATKRKSSQTTEFKERALSSIG